MITTGAVGTRGMVSFGVRSGPGLRSIGFAPPAARSATVKISQTRRFLHSSAELQQPAQLKNLRKRIARSLSGRIYGTVIHISSAHRAESWTFAQARCCR